MIVNMVAQYLYYPLTKEHLSCPLEYLPCDTCIGKDPHDGCSDCHDEGSLYRRTQFITKDEFCGLCGKPHQSDQFEHPYHLKSNYPMERY